MSPTVAADKLPTGSPTAGLVAALTAAFDAAASAEPSNAPPSPASPGAPALDAAVRAALAAYASDPDADWPRFAFWQRTHYVRNLVARDEEGRFEVMVICWAPGQGSRVHNHGDSHCWLACLSGAVAEERFAMPAASTLASLLDPESPATSPTQPPPIPGVLSSCAPCPALAPAGGAVLTPGQVGYVCDASGFLHAVRAAPEGGGAGGVTLHVYAPPITRCRLFEPAEDRVTLRAPGFFSANGARLPVHGASFGAHVGAGDEAGPSRAPPAWGPER